MLYRDSSKVEITYNSLPRPGFKKASAPAIIITTGTGTASKFSISWIFEVDDITGTQNLIEAGYRNEKTEKTNNRNMMNINLNAKKFAGQARSKMKSILL